MFKGLAFGIAAVVSVSGAAVAATTVQPEIQAWVVTPGQATCQIDLELTARSGAVTPVTLVSDGVRLSLRFTKDEIPEQAFLPIRIDQKPFANLVMRTGDGKVGVIELSEETQAALRKGQQLQVGWLGEEPVRASLSGSEQALPDLKTCGAQVAARYRTQQAAELEARLRMEADARAKELADVQLQAARAQADKLQAEADAERQRAANEAQARARADAEAARYQAQQEALDEARRRAEEQERADAYGQGDPYGRPMYRPRYDPYSGAGW